RMGAYVISGIGFIGAGTILVTTENRVQGLATAASIWSAATLGLSIGSGFYAASLVGVFLIVGIIILLRPFKRYIQNKVEFTEISLIVFSKHGFSRFLEYIHSEDLVVSSLNIDQESSGVQAEQRNNFNNKIKIGKKDQWNGFNKKIKGIDGIENGVENNG